MSFVSTRPSEDIEGLKETKLTVSSGASHSLFCYNSQLQIEQCTEFYSEFAAVSKVHLLITCESKVQVVVSLEN